MLLDTLELYRIADGGLKVEGISLQFGGEFAVGNGVALNLSCAATRYRVLDLDEPIAIADDAPGLYGRHDHVATQKLSSESTTEVGRLRLRSWLGLNESRADQEYGQQAHCDLPHKTYFCG